MNDITKKKLGRPSPFNFGALTVGQSEAYKHDPTKPLTAWLKERRHWDERYLVIAKSIRLDKPWLVIRLRDKEQMRKWNNLQGKEQICVVEYANSHLIGIVDALDAWENRVRHYWE